MPQGIYPAQWAELNKARAGEKYQPRNGVEGDIFLYAWCRTCERDKAMREGGEIAECDDNERCDIIAMTMAHEITDPEYPAAWQYAADGQPCCKAFVPAGEPICLSPQELEAAGQERLFS